jgi:hypothetical protein
MGAFGQHYLVGADCYFEKLATMHMVDLLLPRRKKEKKL